MIDTLLKDGAAWTRGARRPSLFWQIALLCSAMIFFTIFCTWLAADTLADRYQTVLSARYGVGMRVAHAMFVDSLHQALLVAAAVGTLASFLAGSVFVPRILRPFQDMAKNADRVAQGDFSVRVDLDGVPQRCEVHALGSAFNRMATQLAHLDNARKRMIADLTHDLLSPLTNLRGYVEGLRDGVVTAAPQVFTMLEGEIGRLIRLVSDLHQLNLAEATRGRLVLAKIAVPQLLADSTSFIAHAAAVRSITIDVTSDGVETVEADHDAIVRVLQNLLHNAVRYAEPNSTVTLTARAVDAWVELKCSNRGSQIAPQDLPFIFDRFYRADPARSREGGAGLGLAIAKELVEAHGGQITATSDDGMTTVTVRLPQKTVIAR
jgi:signal transduction histidine kinase